MLAVRFEAGSTTMETRGENRGSIGACYACQGPVLKLQGEERKICAACDELARKRARAVLANRERQRRWRRRNAAKSDSVTISVEVVRPARFGAGADPYAHLRDRTAPPEPDAAPRSGVAGGVCDCGRPLNLGRYKTGGSTCGTCKRASRNLRRAHPPRYSTFEEVERQLEDDSPIPDDPVTGG